MLQVRNVKLTHKKDFRVILDNFSLNLDKNDKCVIIGEEGNGKSTLLKWIYNPILVEDYVDAVGERFYSKELLGYLPQELPELEKNKSVYEFFCEEPQFFEKNPKELCNLALTLHLNTDFFYEEQAMETLSGGEKIKAQIARILLADPTILLLDEPSNDIDIETLKWLEQFIIETDRTVLFISHDETLIERTANMVVHIEQVRRKTVSRYTVAKTNYTQYISERLAKFDNQEKQAKNDRREEKIRQEKLQRIEQSVAYAQGNVSRQNPHIGRLLKKKMKSVKALEKRYDREREKMTEMPETEDAVFFKIGDNISIPEGKIVIEYTLDKLYTPENLLGHKRLLSEHIFIRVKGPQKVCIVGKNGIGKTTLLRKIAEELLERKDIKAAYMPQNYEELLINNLTPVEFLAESGEKEEITRLRNYLGSMKYTADEMHHQIKELSGGQKAKLLLLKMSISGADVLILDEPTRNFSPLSCPVIRKILTGFEGSIISISHDRKYIKEVCNCVYQLTKEGLEAVDSNLLLSL